MLVRARRRTAVSAAVFALLAGTAVAPAAGAEPAVRVSWIVRPATAGSVTLTVLVCEATAEPGTTAMTPVVLQFACGVNGATAKVMVPGGKAVVWVTSVTRPPYTICYEATAAFSGQTIVVVATGPVCVTR